MRAGRWGVIIGVLLLGVAFVRFCVRIVPADAPTASAGRSTETPPGTEPSSPLIIPVEGVPPSALQDSFVDARGGGTRDHQAIDVMAARGRTVVAASDGRIEKLFWSEAGGRTLYQRTADGRHILYYAHLDSYAGYLREGQVLRRGQPIGTVGSTGNADPAAPHLHFAVHAMADGDPWYGGRPVNPYPLLARP